MSLFDGLPKSIKKEKEDYYGIGGSGRGVGSKGAFTPKQVGLTGIDPIILFYLFFSPCDDFFFFFGGGGGGRGLVIVSPAKHS